MLQFIRTVGTALGFVALIGLVVISTGCSDSSSSSGGSSSSKSVRDRLATGDMESVRGQGVGAKSELIALMGDSDANVRAAAATAIGFLKADGASAIPAMLAAMKHDMGRPQIMYAITDMGSAALPYLLNGVSSTDVTVRRYSTEILAKAGFGKDAADAVDPLIAILKGSDDDKIKTHAVMALAAIGTAAEPALPTIQAVAADAKGDLKVQADGAIRRINDASKPGQYTESR